jgi:hypothetical protein
MTESRRRKSRPTPDDPHSSALWRMEYSGHMISRWGNYCGKGFGTVNYAEFSKASYVATDDTQDNYFIFIPDPKNFCRPLLEFPSDGFAPDFFDFNFVKFCSARLREAFAQPPEVIQYLDVDMLCEGEAALAQDYKVMRLLAHQPAMDLRHSVYDFEVRNKYDTDAAFLHIGRIQRFVLHEGFEPKTEIFRVDEDPLRILVTDALAERVLKAKCKGLEFDHPGYPDYDGGRPHVIRTARGPKMVT